MGTKEGGCERGKEGRKEGKSQAAAGGFEGHIKFKKLPLN